MAGQQLEIFANVSRATKPHLIGDLANLIIRLKSWVSKTRSSFQIVVNWKNRNRFLSSLPGATEGGDREDKSPHFFRKLVFEILADPMRKFRGEGGMYVN